MLEVIRQEGITHLRFDPQKTQLPLQGQSHSYLLFQTIALLFVDQISGNEGQAEFVQEGLFLQVHVISLNHRCRFEKILQKVGGDRYCKLFTAYKQFLTLLVAQISGKDSLREN